MKIQKIGLIAALAVGTLVTCANLSAQEAKDGKKGGRFSVEQRMEQLTTELSLTDAQKPKVKAALEDSQKKMQALGDVPREQRREKMQPIFEEQNKKMKEILTPDQYEKYQKMRQQGKKGEGKKKTE